MNLNSIFEIRIIRCFIQTELFTDDRPEHGGGLIVYVKDGINNKRRYDLECE